MPYLLSKTIFLFIASIPGRKIRQVFPAHSGNVKPSEALEPLYVQLLRKLYIKQVIGLVILVWGLRTVDQRDPGDILVIDGPVPDIILGHAGNIIPLQ